VQSPSLHKDYNRKAFLIYEKPWNLNDRGKKYIDHDTAVRRNPRVHNFTGETKTLNDPEMTNNFEGF